MAMSSVLFLALLASVPDLREWVEIAPFAAGSDELSCANQRTGGEWSVAAAGPSVKVQPFSEAPPPSLGFTLPNDPEFGKPSTSLKVADGVLVGFDRGEWGGGLYWFAPDGTANYQIVSSNIQALAMQGGDAVAFGGLAHLWPPQGKVFELAAPEKGGRWQVKGTLDLGAAPSAIAADPRGGFLIVTSDGLSRYANGSVSALTGAPYMTLYPNSMALSSDGTVYIGMRHAVARLVPNDRGYAERWLVPPACRELAIAAGSRPECSCRSTK